MTTPCDNTTERRMATTGCPVIWRKLWEISRLSVSCTEAVCCRPTGQRTTASFDDGSHAGSTTCTQSEDEKCSPHVTSGLRRPRHHRILRIPVVRDLQNNWEETIWVHRRGEEPVRDGSNRCADPRHQLTTTAFKCVSPSSRAAVTLCVPSTTTSQPSGSPVCTTIGWSPYVSSRHSFAIHS